MGNYRKQGKWDSLPLLELFPGGTISILLF